VREKKLMAAARRVLKSAGVGRAAVVVKGGNVVITVAAATLERIAAS